MPDKYRRPSPASPPLRFVGGGPPIVTPEHAYEMSKDAGDLNIDRSISIPVVGNIGPRTQTGITSGLNILGAVQEYREALAEIKDLQRSLEIRSIGITARPSRTGCGFRGLKRTHRCSRDNATQ